MVDIVITVLPLKSVVDVDVKVDEGAYDVDLVVKDDVVVVLDEVILLGLDVVVL